MATAQTPGKGWVYLLHLEQPIGTERQQARHYLGWTDDVERRVWEHRAGVGARFTRAAVRRGIQLSIAATWPGTRELERAYKLWHAPCRLCPICKELEHQQEPQEAQRQPVTLWSAL